MAEAFADDLRVDALAEHDLRVCVPHVVDSKARETRARRDPQPRSPQIAGLERGSDTGREHEVAVDVGRASREPRFRLPTPMAAQDRDGVGDSAIARRDSRVFGWRKTIP